MVAPYTFFGRDKKIVFSLYRRELRSLGLVLSTQSLIMGLSNLLLKMAVFFGRTTHKNAGAGGSNELSGV